jgi:Holliday junction DNA helicase RuvA
MDGNPQMGKQVPRLIGFLTEAEREFFDLFCSVDGIGTRKALRAMLRPVSEIATAIEEKDEKFITSLPGIGAAMAERVVAKLRRKVPKFALLVTRQVPESETQPDIVTEAFNALIGLGHTESEARRLIDTVIETKTKFKTWDEILNAIYQKNKS